MLLQQLQWPFLLLAAAIAMAATTATSTTTPPVIPPPPPPSPPVAKRTSLPWIQQTASSQQQQQLPRTSTTTANDNNSRRHHVYQRRRQIAAPPHDDDMVVTGIMSPDDDGHRRFSLHPPRGGGGREHARAHASPPPPLPRRAPPRRAAADNDNNVCADDGDDIRRHYQVIASAACEPLARRLHSISAATPTTTTAKKAFTFHKTDWGKFLDGTDRIVIGGMHPVNFLRGQHVLFLASFHTNDATWSQFQVMITLLQSFVRSLTVVLPFYPTGTMERVTQEGQVATANTLAQMFSNLPNCGFPTRVITYDLHTLQNRFYLSNNAIADLQTTIPLLCEKITGGGGGGGGGSPAVDCVAFPDDGAAKRFAALVGSRCPSLPVVVCGKQRGDGDRRRVRIQDGDPRGRRVVIVDDMIQTGGTLYECGKTLLAAGAESVSAFCAHAVFPRRAWVRFAKRGGDRAIFERFWVTNSVPTVTNTLPKDDVFEVIDILPQLLRDL